MANSRSTPGLTAPKVGGLVGAMGDREAAEARRRKLRLLEQSLFGAEGAAAVGLPQVKAVDEYHEVAREAATLRTREQVAPSVLENLPRFYKEPKKKVRGLVEPPGSPAVRSIPSTASSDLGGSRVTLADWEEEPPSAPPPPPRPRTATAAQLLAEELETLGRPAEGGRQRQAGTRRVVGRQVAGVYSPSGEGFGGRRVEVEEKSVRWDRATVLVGEGGEESAGQLGGRGRSRGGRSELLLSKEQDELSTSLSSAKFLMLKNANLERVKQLEQRLGDKEEAVVARKAVDQARPTTSSSFHHMPDTFARMPTDVYSEMPTDTFDDIPDDVFEDIPRAVTARIRNRERLKPQRQEEQVFEQETAATEDYTASAPLEELAPGQEHVGFVAMLFAGTNLPREAREESHQLEKDFMFALFIQKQEEATSMDGNPRQAGERDPTVGHFCAPFCPGFCEANLCIFHTSN